ncbi:MAG TPA: twin-arginine translocation signal domain-containing protein [Acidimicrobiales bacterium]
MATFNDKVGPRDTGGTIGRRGFMRKAAVAGTGAFVVPMIVTVNPADAQALTSPPPEPPGKPQSPTVDRGSSPGTASPPATGAQPNARTAGRRVTGRTQLPRTGADLDRLVVAGLAATAGGAALVLWSADVKSANAKSVGAKSADPPSET